MMRSERKESGCAFTARGEDYGARVRRHTPPSPLLKDCLLAFLFGGGICALGELLAALFRRLGAGEEEVYPLVTVGMIFLAALLTGLGVYDRIAKHAGAGTLVPVTGFANSVVSPAIDTKSEGAIVGVGAKIFTVAGPVILYAVLAGTLYGVIYYIAGASG